MLIASVLALVLAFHDAVHGAKAMHGGPAGLSGSPSAAKNQRLARLITPGM
jgi:hypothetical protein